MRKSLRRSFVLAALCSAGVACATKEPPLPYSSDQARAQLLGRFPPGSSVDATRRTLEAEGYFCEFVRPETGAPAATYCSISWHPDLPPLYVGTLPPGESWQVVLLAEPSGGVRDVQVEAPRTTRR